MGYFSNGTEGLYFQERYCWHCANWRDLDDGRGEGCPVWDAHLLFSYDECNSKSNAKTILEMLIKHGTVIASDGSAASDNECLMFLPRVEGTVPGQIAMGM